MDQISNLGSQVKIFKMRQKLLSSINVKCHNQTLIQIAAILANLRKERANRKKWSIRDIREDRNHRGAIVALGLTKSMRQGRKM